MNKQAWIIFSVVVVAILGSLIYMSGKDKVDVSNIDTNAIQAASNQNGQIGDHVFGNKDSEVVLIEYGDFQCPGCGAAFPALKTVSEKYEKDLAFVFRNFPLTTIHPNARAAAAAAEAAGKLGKYWEMHDALYANQDAWENSTGNTRTDVFVQYATTLGLDENEFRDLLNDPSINKKISFDQALGKKVGVSSTPGLYLNGKRIDNLRVKDGKAIESDDDTLPFVWSDATTLDTLILQPAFKEAGVTPTTDK